MLCESFNVWYNGEVVKVVAVSQDLNYFLVADPAGKFIKAGCHLCIYYNNNTKHKVKG